MERCAFFYDGFNLYHAVDDMRQHHLKWLDLHALSLRFLSPQSQSLEAVYYFSAFATWLAGPMARHKTYVRALEAVGVVPVMGNFKARRERCHSCESTWIGHEEKESDVNLAIHLLDLGHKDAYDAAYVVTQDSDLAPALKLVAQNFPGKRLVAVSPPRRKRSEELSSVATASRRTKPHWLASCLLPRKVMDSSGNVVATRPVRYDPPG